MTVSVNGKKVQRTAGVLSEDQGRTTHDSEMKNVSGEPGEIELYMDGGSGVLFLWYVEILIKEAPPLPVLEGKPTDSMRAILAKIGADMGGKDLSSQAKTLEDNFIETAGDFAEMTAEQLTAINFPVGL